MTRDFDWRAKPRCDSQKTECPSAWTGAARGVPGRTVREGNGGRALPRALRARPLAALIKILGFFAAWLACRGEAPGRCSRAWTRTARQRPHGLRLTAITEALDLGADVRAVGGASADTGICALWRYDGRLDLGGDVARRGACLAK